jgi:hypothetical protein
MKYYKVIYKLRVLLRGQGSLVVSGCKVVEEENPIKAVEKVKEIIQLEEIGSFELVDIEEVK